MNALDFIKKLVMLPRFWVSAIAVIGGVVLYVQGTIPVDKLAELLTALAAVIIGAITVDNAIKGLKK